LARLAFDQPHCTAQRAFGQNELLAIAIVIAYN
jgi:hypothetical protein